MLDHLEQQHGSTVAIPADYFWSVPAPEIYDVTASPELTIGQLSESWDNVTSERESGDGDTISFALVRLGGVMKAIGRHTVR